MQVDCEFVEVLSALLHGEMIECYCVEEQAPD
jgi:hypothetical protein